MFKRKYFDKFSTAIFLGNKNAQSEVCLSKKSEEFMLFCQRNAIFFQKCYIFFSLFA